MTSMPAGSMPSSKRTLKLAITRCVSDVAYKLPYSFQGTLDVRRGIRKRESQISFSVITEGGARQCRNAGFVQQPIREFIARETDSADVREKKIGRASCRERV